jgi:replication fork protection complex subunit Tof1/Swi1
MKLVGIERLAPSLEETPESVWIVPGHITADQLKKSVELIQKAEFSPPIFEQGQLAADQLRRKSAARKRANFDDDGGDDVNDFLADDEVFFPADGPAPRDATKAGKKNIIRRRRRTEDDEDDDGPTEAELKARARARKLRELEKARKIKSEMYVHESDDEDWDEDKDREFFAREEELRQRVGKAISDGTAAAVDGNRKEKKRKTSALDSDMDEEMDEGPSMGKGSGRKRRSNTISIDGADSEGVSSDEPAPQAKRRRKIGPPSKGLEDEDEQHISSTQSSGTTGYRDTGADSDDGIRTDDTPLSSSPRVQTGALSDLDGQVPTGKVGMAVDEDDEEDLPVAAKVRPRVRGGFILDDSDDE